MREAPLACDGSRKRRGAAWEVVYLALCGAAALAVALGVKLAFATVPTTVADFYAPGTQPHGVDHQLVFAGACMGCHTDYEEWHNDTGYLWSGSMMAQSARDPIFYAALAIANQDASFAGEFCLRCHAPQGWQRGNSKDPSGGMLSGADFDGVSCSVCHRAVDPVYRPGESPAPDESILAMLAGQGNAAHTMLFTDAQGNSRIVPKNHNGSLALDPLDRRRGPYALDVNPHGWLQSGYHRDPALCSHCHDVSNPVYTRTSEGAYRLNDMNAAHPSGDKYAMFPIERTYSEWLMSDFGRVGPQLLPDATDPTRNRFGGNTPSVQTCQDCHMPRTVGHGAVPGYGATQRDDLARHVFQGANSWVLRAVRDLYPDEKTRLDAGLVEDSIARNHAMLAAASDLEAVPEGGEVLRTRVVNRSGHKLPTGYNEGRRMWVNVRFFSASGALLREHGHYDDALATLDGASTKVYEAKAGLDAHAAGASGKPEGESFHFVLNNTWLMDNRIPPVGFENARFASVQAAPVAYAYADGQHWDDTRFAIPPAARRAEVRVFHQTTTREYIEFLRDENRTNLDGQVAYDRWLAHGKSAPVLMDEVSMPVVACSTDFNGDGDYPTPLDLEDLLAAIANNDPAADINGDGVVDDEDADAFALRLAGAPCPGAP